ncbi:hypothetical protein BDZ94DRAFT_1324671 [Collybia nuda]|uniref:F-box domain-containing protein n=1 Tax=Collybia nuda TaxID=64659 RepID=A0A9P5XZM1_9AGAR|nr:hypothetical protein BDZ94DRAFT_1324671 [Collybia nuda]
MAHQETEYHLSHLESTDDELLKLGAGLTIVPERQPYATRNTKRDRAPMGSINTLPIELIPEVILFLIPFTPSKIEMQDLRLQVTQICSSWRSVAFGTSEIWDMRRMDIKDERMVDLIASWVRQCTCTGIALTTAGRDQFSDRFLEGVVIPYAHKFKDLSCPEVPPGLWDSLRFDVLTTLNLRFTSSEMYPDDYLRAPLLRQLVLLGELRRHYTPIGSTLLQCLPKVSWGRLTSVSVLGSVSFDDIYGVLSLCMLLEHCELKSVYDIDRFNGPVTPITLPHLEELQIRFESRLGSHRLSLLNLPSLVSFATTFPSKQGNDFEEFLTFLTQNATTLRHFEIIEDGTPNIDYVDEIIRALPFATHFSAPRQHISRPILAEIGSGERLRNLKTLGFSERGETGDEMLDALFPQKQHSNGGSSLSQVKIYRGEGYGVPSEERVRALRSEGIGVEVVWLPFMLWD